MRTGSARAGLRQATLCRSALEGPGGAHRVPFLLLSLPHRNSICPEPGPRKDREHQAIHHQEGDPVDWHSRRGTEGGGVTLQTSSVKLGPLPEPEPGSHSHMVATLLPQAILCAPPSRQETGSGEAPSAPHLPEEGATPLLGPGPSGVVESV